MTRQTSFRKTVARGPVLVLLLCLAQAVVRASPPTGLRSDSGQNDDSVWASPAEGPEASPQRRGPGPPVRGVYKARITPHWFQNDTRFWYRNDLRDRTKEFIVVDAES